MLCSSKLKVEGALLQNLSLKRIKTKHQNLLSSSVHMRIKHTSRAGEVPVILRPIPEAYIVKIPSRVSRDLQHEMLGMTVSPYEDFEAFLSRSRDIVAALVPANIADRVRQTSYSGKGFVVLTGLPVDPELPNTPVTPGEAIGLKKTFVSEALSLGVSGLLGCEPFGFRQEGFGSAPLVDNVVPIDSTVNRKAPVVVPITFRFIKKVHGIDCPRGFSF